MRNTRIDMNVNEKREDMEPWQTFWFAWRKLYKMVIIFVEYWDACMFYEYHFLYYGSSTHS